MRILVVAPRSKPEVREIDGELKTLQKIVGGSIQAVYPFDEPVALVANDEGKLLGFPMNRALRDDDGQIYDILCGTFFLCRIEEDHLHLWTRNKSCGFRKFLRFRKCLSKSMGSY